MIVFADSSALVTRYAPTEIDILPSGTATLTVSALARVEVASALWQKAALGDLAAADAARLVRSFEADWMSGTFAAVRLDGGLLAHAAGLSGIHRLRSLDAIQLACALAARAAEPACRAMVVLDERLRRAAATERFELLPA